MTFSPPTTTIEIVSQAAVICGKQSFNTLTSGGAFAQDGAALLDTLVSAELGSNRWRFAQASQQMSVINTLTPTFDGWEYYWQMPADVLMFFYVTPQVNYRVFGDRVLLNTNQTTLNAVYSESLPVSKWPPAFSMYMVFELASMLGMSVTNSDRMMARIEAQKSLWHSRALFADGQNTPTESLRSQPWVNVRYQYRTRRG